MDAETERRLAVAALAGDTGARNELVMSVSRFVWGQSFRLARKYKCECEDLYQTGMYKICKTFPRFDPNRQRRFITYAGLIAIREMERVAKTDHVIRLPTNFEKSPNTLAAAERATSTMQFSTLDTDADALPGSARDPLDIAGDAEERRIVKCRMGRLNADQRRVVRLKLSGKNESAIGRIIQRSKTRVQQIRQAAFEKLRSSA